MCVRMYVCMCVFRCCSSSSACSTACFEQRLCHQPLATQSGSHRCAAAQRWNQPVCMPVRVLLHCCECKMDDWRKCSHVASWLFQGIETLYDPAAGDIKWTNITNDCVYLGVFPHLHVFVFNNKRTTQMCRQQHVLLIIITPW